MAYIVNAFQIPNDLVDRLLLELSPNALKCYLVIVRKTIGWGKEYDAISASQFAALTGIRKSDTIWAAIRELKELGLIEDISIPGKPTQFKVVTQIYPENGDTPKNGLSHPEGVIPTPKKGITLKRDTQNSSSLKSNKSTISSSSLPPLASREDDKEVIFGELIALDQYSVIPEEGMDDLNRETIVTGIEQLVLTHAGDADSYRTALIREVISGGGRTLANIRRQPALHHSRRIGSNRTPSLPLGLSVFDLYEALRFPISGSTE